MRKKEKPNLIGKDFEEKKADIFEDGEAVYKILRDAKEEELPESVVLTPPAYWRLIQFMEIKSWKGSLSLGGFNTKPIETSS